MNYKKTRVLLIIALITLIITTVGMSIAFFSYVKEGYTSNELTAGTVKLHYDEVNKKGRGISITDALPVDDNNTAKVNEPYFEFKIESESTNLDISYVVTARMSSDSDIELGDAVDIYTTEVDGSNETAVFGGIHKYNELEQVSKIPVNKYIEKVIYSDTVSAGTTNNVRTFRLRMWVDSKINYIATPNPQTGEVEYPYNDKSMTLTVNVYTVDNQVNPPALSSGLYDGDNNLLASWQELVDTYNLDISKNYNPYSTSEYVTSLKSIITNNFSNYSSLSLIIDNSVTSIGDYVCYGCGNLKSLSIPNSVTRVGEYAFAGFDVSSLVIPETLTDIGMYSFAWSPSLTSVTLPSNMTSIPKGLLYASYALENIDIPSTVTSIEDNAFTNCTSLDNVVLPEGVISIGESAFAGCSSLKNITIPSTVTTFGNGVFAGCSSMTTTPNLNNITVIPQSFFANCRSLINVTIPNTVTTIGYNAFGYCTSLESIDIPSSVTTIENGAFSDSGLTTLTIPSSVETVGSFAFRNTKISSITIPSTVTNLGESVFTRCANLTSVTLPDDMVTIPADTFASCTSLEEITIPASVKNIGNSAFNNTGLKEVTIPTNVEYIGQRAFQSTTKLTKVIFEDPTTWYARRKQTDTSETLLDVTDPEYSAQILNATYYGIYFWYKH